MPVYQILPLNRISLGTGLCLIIAVLGLKVTAEQSSSSKPLIVTVKLERPYAMLSWDPDHNGLIGNDRFEGFLIDILSRLARRANFTYVIRVVHDNQYGIPLTTHKSNSTEWTGIIGELLRGEADLAVGATTITEERMSVVEFTESYLRRGRTIVIKKPLNPSEAVPFNDFEGLANQTDIQYGFVAGGYTYSFFQSSILEPYKTMFAHVSAHYTNLARDYEDGINRVRNSNGSYAFIMEKTQADYVTVRSPCDITSVGEIDPQDYGIALPKNSPWTKRLSSVIKQMKSDGTIQELHNFWWYFDRNCNL